MRIHPLWALCILTRLLLALNIHRVSLFVPLVIGIGFVYKGITGSNEETQIAKVFWHDTRYFHGVVYLMAAYYIQAGKPDIARIILITDVLFSIMYRFFT